MSAELYLFEPLHDERFCSLDGPWESSGEAESDSWLQPGMARGFAKTTSRGDLPDCFGLTTRCLSPNLVRAMDGLPWRECVESVPVAVQRHGKVVSEYLAILPRQDTTLPNPVDYRRSGVRYRESGEINLIRDYVLYRERIPQKDLFCLHGDWIVSARLRACLLDSSITNCRWEPVAVTAAPPPADPLDDSRVMADRIRQATERCQMAEAQMFGGIGFLWQGQFCVAAQYDRLIARIGPKAAALAIASPHIELFNLGGGFFPHDRSPRYWKSCVTIASDPLDDAELKAWINGALTFVAGQLRLTDPAAPPPMLAE